MTKLLYLHSLAVFLESYVHEHTSLEDNFVHFNELYGSYAISKAENSTLTLEEAGKLQSQSLSDYGQVIKEEIIGLDINSLLYQSKLKKLHDKLEFSNIIQVFRRVNSLDYARSISFDIGRFCDIHTQLTKELDQLFAGILHGYDSYYPGVLRAKDNIVIGTRYPMPAEDVAEQLQIRCKQAQTITSVDDIFALHSRLYYIHPFSNGNKRICRIAEIVMLQQLGVDTNIIPPSLGYYRQQPRYIKRLIETSLIRRDYTRFVPFAYGSLLLGVLYMLHRELRKRKGKLLSEYKNLQVLALLQEGNRITTSQLQRHRSLRKFSRARFFELLDSELQLLGTHILKQQEGRNMYYSLNIQDPVYQSIKQKFQELLDIYKDENQGYREISFLQYW